MIYEVPLMLLSTGFQFSTKSQCFDSSSFPRGLEKGNLKTFRILPTNELCDWLAISTKSFATIETIFKHPAGFYMDRQAIGLLFGFHDAKDAALFKLAWG